MDNETRFGLVAQLVRERVAAESRVRSLNRRRERVEVVERGLRAAVEAAPDLFEGVDTRALAECVVELL